MSVVVPVVAPVEEKKSGRRPPPGRRGGFGRQKGTPNKASGEVRDAIKRFLLDPEYQNNVMKRIEKGDAPHLEKYFWELCFGRPKVVLEVQQPSRTAPLAAVLRALPKEDRLKLAELSRKALAAQARIIEGEPAKVVDK